MTRLKHYMDSHGIRPSWLAEKVGVSTVIMSNYRSGLTDIPAEVLLEMADIFKVAPRELIGEVEAESVAA